MGKLIAVLLPLLAAWGSLASIFPDWFGVRRNHPVWNVLLGPKSRWFAVV